ncbi:MAG TPA: pyridoxal-phosphate dependent enzyme [Thermoanaerobaculia bacterium]|nr:pyridoxal-phosphate dependent enzyme [Thermoanaerobaculia bacterium]
MIETLASTTTIACSGCGFVPPRDAQPFRCPVAGKDKGDHVLTRRLGGVRPEPFLDSEPNPFVRYRQFTHAWHTAIAAGMSDAHFITLVRQLDEKIAAVDGHGFRVTPFASRPDGIWIKDETGNVTGSHKGRHLMGIMIWLLVAERRNPWLAKQRLAIASCGNAALAAAVIAHAAGRPLDVFIPATASNTIVERLKALGADVARCAREKSEFGDPSYLRFREAVARGSLPFTCQGSENGLAIEGGETLGWEMVSQANAANIVIDRLFIQVGGGALASSCIAAFEEAHAAGVIPRLPKVHAVQTKAVHPLIRAYERVVARGGLKALQAAIEHRSDFMWPWESEPHSVAEGILDDETYDWAAVVRGMLMTGGSPVLVSEQRLLEAQKKAGVPVSVTGASGLAGLIETGLPKGENVAVIFSGRA